MIEVVLCGLGSNGASIARLVANRSDFRIVGVIDIDPAKVGQDVGTVVGLGRPLGVIVSNDASAIVRAKRPDIVIQATTSSLAEVAPQIRDILRAGVSVISTCEELSFPFERAPELARDLDRLARAQQVALLGTGINPGFAMDTLPIALTAVSQEVTAIKVERIQDLATRRLPLQKQAGVGLTEAEFAERQRVGTIGHVGLGESLDAIARAIGWKITSRTERIEPVVAEHPVGNGNLAIEAGRICGFRQTIQGMVDEETRITLELHRYLGAPSPHDRIVVEGVPRVDVTLSEGTHGDQATAAIVVNAIPSLLDGEPGLRVMTDLSVVHYRRPTPDVPPPHAEHPRRTLAF